MQPVHVTRDYEMEVRPHIGPGPGSQEGTCESLKDPIALAIDVLSIFHWGVGVGGGGGAVFSTIFSLFRK